MSVLVSLVMLTLAPGLGAYLLRRLWPKEGRWLDLAIVVSSSALPIALIFHQAQQADGITRATSFVVVPFLLLLTLSSAAFGLAMAPKSSSIMP